MGQHRRYQPPMNPQNFFIVSLSDQPQLLDKLVEQQWQVWGYDDPNDLRAFFAKELTDNTALPKTWGLLNEQHTLIAAVSLSLDEMGTRQPKAHNPWLGYLYVHPDYRGQGLAKKLTQHAVQAAQAMGYPSVYLYASDERPRYEKWGWQPLDTFQFQGEIVTVMVNP